MKSLQSRRFRVAALAVVLLLITFQAVHQFVNSRRELTGNSMPDYDVGSTVPGNPQNEVTGLKSIYRVLNLYRKQHGGSYPINVMELLSDVRVRYTDYGLHSRLEADKLFESPDVRFSDEFQMIKGATVDSIIPYEMFSVRYDGTPVGGDKKPGTRDVLAWTDTYVHQNIHQTGVPSANPVGFYMVLWDDGTISKVPYNKILYVPAGGGNYADAFPGQAGVPNNAVTYDQFQRRG